jgi:hypothetical protein
VEHALPRQVLGVGVAGGVALGDADAEAEGHAATDGLDLLFLEDVVGGDPVLVVEVGVVAAGVERRRQEPLGQRGVDGTIAARREWRGQRRGHGGGHRR